MDDYDFESIPDETWDDVARYFRENPQAMKYSKKESDHPVSFIKIDNKIMAIAPDVSKKQKGSYGSVKTVYDKESNKRYAVKIQDLKGVGHNPYYEVEVSALRELDELVGAGNREYTKKNKQKDKHYLVMNKYDSDLDDYLKNYFGNNPKGDKARQIEFMFYIVESLINLKDRGLYHWDFRTQNVFLNHDGNGVITRLNMGDHGSTTNTEIDEKDYLYRDIKMTMYNSSAQLNRNYDLERCFTGSDSFEEARAKILQLKEAKKLNLNEVKTNLSPSLLLYRANDVFAGDKKLSPLLSELTSIRNNTNLNAKQRLEQMTAKIEDYKQDPAYKSKLKKINKLQQLCHLEGQAQLRHNAESPKSAKDALIQALDAYLDKIGPRVDAAKSDPQKEYAHPELPFKERFQIKVSNKESAAKALKDSLESGQAIDTEHTKALCQGTLKKELNNALGSSDSSELCDAKIDNIKEFIDAYNNKCSSQLSNQN